MEIEIICAVAIILSTLMYFAFSASQRDQGEQEEESDEEYIDTFW